MGPICICASVHARIDHGPVHMPVHAWNPCMTRASWHMRETRWQRSTAIIIASIPKASKHNVKLNLWTQARLKYELDIAAICPGTPRRCWCGRGNDVRNGCAEGDVPNSALQSRQRAGAINLARSICVVVQISTLLGPPYSSWAALASASSAAISSLRAFASALSSAFVIGLSSSSSAFAAATSSFIMSFIASSGLS